MKGNCLSLLGLTLPAIMLCSCDGGDGAAGSRDEPGSGADPGGACNPDTPDPAAGDHKCRCGGLMFWTESAVVRSAKLDGTGVATVFGGSVPLGVALDSVARKVYWADNGTDSIHRANYDGSAVELLYTNADRFSNPRGMAVWIDKCFPGGP